MPASDPRALYRAVWRWHFYAGLIVLPMLLWLAVTGALYLYKPEIEALVYARWASVVPGARPVPLDRMVGAVEARSGGHVAQIMRPADPSASWRMTIVGQDGVRRLGFVDPYRAVLLGTTREGGIMQLVRSLHSLAITGPVGNALVEIVAGWAVLLVLSGLYLWWPRRGAPMIALRGHPRRRLFWRDLHASTGALAAAIILFLALTGMPWTGVAGRQLQGWIAASQLGRPAPPPGAGERHDHGRASLPWSMQAAAVPHGAGGRDIGPSRIAAIAARTIAPPWTMTRPAKLGAPYLVSRGIARAEDAEILYLDAASGRPLQHARYAGFGTGAKTIEWGIAVHQGQQYGEPNRLVMLAGCGAIVLLAISAPVLWWKRRRNGRLAAPPRADDPRTVRAATAALVAVAACFPLTCLTMIAALVAELGWRRLARGA